LGLLTQPPVQTLAIPLTPSEIERDSTRLRQVKEKRFSSDTLIFLGRGKGIRFSDATLTLLVNVKMLPAHRKGKAVGVAVG